MINDEPPPTPRRAQMYPPTGRSATAPRTPSETAARAARCPSRWSPGSTSPTTCPHHDPTVPGPAVAREDETPASPPLAAGWLAATAAARHAPEAAGRRAPRGSPLRSLASPAEYAGAAGRASAAPQPEAAPSAPPTAPAAVSSCPDQAEAEQRSVRSPPAVRCAPQTPHRRSGEDAAPTPVTAAEARVSPCPADGARPRATAPSPDDGAPTATPQAPPAPPPWVPKATTTSSRDPPSQAVPAPRAPPGSPPPAGPAASLTYPQRSLSLRPVLREAALDRCLRRAFVEVVGLPRPASPGARLSYRSNRTRRRPRDRRSRTQRIGHSRIHKKGRGLARWTPRLNPPRRRSTARALSRSGRSAQRASHQLTWRANGCTGRRT